MAKKIMIASLVILLVLGIAGCGSVEPLQTETDLPETAAATATPAATEPSPTPEPTSVSTPAASPSGDPMDVPAGEAGIAKYHDFDYEGTNRTYMLYIPEGVRKDAPLVFVLHGYLDFASNFMNTTGMNAVAKKEGFGVVYPQGLSSQGSEFPGTHWNADFTFSDVDDIGFLTSLAAYLQEDYGFSSSNTFACGLSNGGFMSYTLAVRAPGVFRAIASVAGTMSLGTWNGRDESAAIPVLQIHGTADTTVPLDGTMTLDGGWGGAPPMDEIIRFWAERDGAGTMTEETTGNITARVYSDGESDWVWFYLIEGFGHRWPDASSGMNTSELIWQFFSSYIE